MAYANDDLGNVVNGSIPNAGPYGVNLTLQNSSDATSDRAGLLIGFNWLLGQDSQGSGTKDYFLYNATTAALAMSVAPSTNFLKWEGPMEVAGSIQGDTSINTAQDYGSPYIDVSPDLAAIGYGSNWYSANVNRRTFTGAHSDARFNQFISCETAGSQGESDPATADYNLGMAIWKTDWLTDDFTSAVAGEINNAALQVRQGAKGDASGILLNVGKLGHVGGVLGTEFGVHTLAPDPADPTDETKALRTNSVQGATGFIEHGGDSFGLFTEKRTQASGTAFIARNFDNRTPREIANGIAAGQWDNLLKGTSSRDLSSEYARIDNQGRYFVQRKNVIGSRKTGWGVPTGTLSRATFAAYAGQTVSNPPTQAQVQAIDNHLKVLSRTLAGLITDLHSAAADDTPSSTGHGLIGA